MLNVYRQHHTVMLRLSGQGPIDNALVVQNHKVLPAHCQQLWAECVGVVCAEHDALDPEYSILKQRLARRIRYEGMNDEDVQKMDLVQITKACTSSKTPTSPPVYWTESHVMLYIHLPSC